MKRRGHFYPLRLKGVPERRQGLIFYLCRCYDCLSDEKRQKLDNLYERIGGPHAAALRAVMATNESYTQICADNHIASEAALWRLRESFYTEFPLDDMLS